MSMELRVALARDLAFTSAEIRAAARDLGFDIALDHGFALEAVFGFQPGTWEGIRTGVEMYRDPVADVVDDIAEYWPEAAQTLSRDDIMLTFRWGADALEGAFALAVAAALATLGAGPILDPETATIIDSRAAANGARDLRELARERYP